MAKKQKALTKRKMKLPKSEAESYFGDDWLDELLVENDEGSVGQTLLVRGHGHTQYNFSTATLRT